SSGASPRTSGSTSSRRCSATKRTSITRSAATPARSRSSRGRPASRARCPSAAARSTSLSEAASTSTCAGARSSRRRRSRCSRRAPARSTSPSAGKPHEDRSMTTVALVFRTVGERTSELALELAKANIQPDETYVLADHRPFSETVRRMVEIDFGTDQIVAVDADALILEDMRPWLEKNREPYVDCYVFDRFRGRIHCGVHVTRADVMRAMREVAPPVGEEAYVLRPESRLRKLALNRLGHQKAFKRDRKSTRLNSSHVKISYAV